MRRSERLLLGGLAAVSLILRALAFFRYRFDSDEPQHLHVAWGWTAGLVQYRDFFDNHAPLFHLVTAPLVALFGERADILLWMRAPMLILFAIVVYATYTIGRELYDERVALWAAVLLSLFPPFFLKSLEYRTDNLWNALWMLALLATMRRRWFVAGLLLGAAMAVSLKTTLLLATLGITALILGRRNFRILAPFAAGFAIIPAALLIFFASVGAWQPMLYCVFEFNSRVALTRKYVHIGRVLYPFAMAVLIFIALRFRRVTENSERYFAAVAIAVFSVTLGGFWILISPRDFLPIMPWLAMFTAAGLMRTVRPLTALAVVAVVFILGVVRYADRFENKTDWHITMMNQLLRLSHPGEPVIDVKGETVYRRRATYPIYEAITRAQIARGMLRDTIAEDVVRTRCHVAQADGPMWPPLGRAFLSANFIDMGRLRASGQWMKPDGSFTIAVPGEYMIMNARGELRGVLDGTPYTGARELAAGAHRFAPGPGNQPTAVVWAPAIRRGHSPFNLRDREF